MTHRRAALLGLILLGLALELLLLHLDRASLDRALAEEPAATAIRELWKPLEWLAGTFPGDTPESGENRKIARLFGFLGAAFGVYLTALWVATRALPASDRPTVWVVVAFSVLFRLTLVPFPPVLETDPDRFLWDGAVVAHGISPYAYTPDDVRGGGSTPKARAEIRVLRLVLATDPRLAAHFARIGVPNKYSPYPPLAQVTCAVAYLIAPSRLEVLKIINVSFDLGVLALVIAFLHLLGRNLNWAILYGWSPLVLKEYANSCHLDPPATFFLLVGLWALVRGRGFAAGCAIGVAALFKFYPLVAGAALVRRLGWAGAAAIAGVVALGYAPFFVSDSAALVGIFAMGTQWEFNSSVFALVERFWSLWIDTSPTRGTAARATATVCILAAVAWQVRRRHETPEEVLGAARAAIAALLVFSPIVNPWYVGWILPFVALAPSAAWLALSMTVNLYYAYFWITPEIPQWGYKPGVRLLEYVPFYALLAREARR